ncbi:MAG: magnesium/cobalt transporter CorA [Propionivibrio sp.]|uniref:magnesium/cobalt transporter CorA n=1 Tax=Propionivibrio sp. TaxID=2212460 RepID=UPI0025DABF7C|nr:magnesium/cobalt transporter CorA [Propionivibrio sp.]MBL0206423.1 magnesium/cobalt transporter CorA [Propionivibrio sp.]
MSEEKILDNLGHVRAMLAKHKLVEDLVHRQDMPRHDLVEEVVHNQHPVGMRSLLERIPLAEIAQIIEALEPEDRLLVWEEVREERGESILEILSDEVRQELIGDSHHRNEKTTVSAFELRNGRLSQINVNTPYDLKCLKPIWVDLVAPTPEIRAWVGRFFDVQLPNPSNLTDLEASARFYIEDNGEIHLHSDFLLDTKEGSRNVAVALILHRDILFTVRTEELPVFRLQRLRARTQPGYVTDGKDVLLDLYAADAEYSADALEDVYAALEEVSKHVLGTEITDTEAAKILADIAREEDLNGRIRRNVHDTRRAVSFLTRGKFLNADQLEDARQILRDIESLDGHTSFLFGKINFLMDATVGFININQNKIIKIFSVASVAMLPPTLIASIYGMNFKVGFPELDWEYGYPFSLVLMFISIVVPFWFFRKKGWLR